MTTNFVQCAVRSCSKTSNAFPLKYEDVDLVQKEVDFDPQILINLLPRLDWPNLVKVCEEVSYNVYVLLILFHFKTICFILTISFI